MMVKTTIGIGIGISVFNPETFIQEATIQNTQYMYIYKYTDNEQTVRNQFYYQMSVVMAGECCEQKTATLRD